MNQNFENIQIRGKQEELRRKEFLVFLSWTKDFPGMYDAFQVSGEASEGLKEEIAFFLDTAKKYSSEDFKKYITESIHLDGDAGDVINEGLIRRFGYLELLDKDLHFEKKEEIESIFKNVFSGIVGAMEKYITYISENSDQKSKYRIDTLIDKKCGYLLSLIDNVLDYIPESYFDENVKKTLVKALKYRYTYLAENENLYGVYEAEKWTFRLLNEVHQIGPEENPLIGILKEKILVEMERVNNVSLSDRERKHAQRFIIKTLAVNCDLEISNIAKKYLDSLLVKFGVTSENISKSWIKENREIDSEFILQNIKRMDELENDRPGAVKTLYNEFGLTMFRKYSKDLLVHQFDQKDQNIPYGIYATTIEGNDKAIGVEQRFSNPGILSETGNALRFFEFESGFSFLKRISQIDKRYGSENKIAYCIFSAHGGANGNTFLVGGSQNPRIASEDFNSERIQMIAPLFSGNPNFLFLACNSGKEDKMAQVLSKIPGATVVAPHISVNNYQTEILFDQADGKLIPKPVERFKNVYNTYKNGQMVPEKE